MLLRSILMIFLLSSFASLVSAKSTTGNNNGDAIRILFTEARLEATAMVKNFDAKGKESLFSPSVLQFVTSHQPEIAAEISGLTLEWTDEKTAACAHTESTRGAPIYLSFSACGATTKSLADAIKTLLHETTHHFGYGNTAQNEAFADEVALTIFAADQRALVALPELPFAGRAAETPEEAKRLWTESCEELKNRIFHLIDADRISGFDCGEPNEWGNKEVLFVSSVNLKVRLGVKPLTYLTLDKVEGVTSEDEHISAHSWQNACFLALESAKAIYGARFVAGHCGESSRSWSITFADTSSTSSYSSEPKIWILAE